MRFPTKVDGWIAVLLGVLPVVGVVGAGTALAAGSYGGAVIGILPVAVLYGGLLFPMHYEVGDALVVRFGLARVRIPFAEVRSVRPSGNPISSPAMSLDRLEVEYGTRRILISPRDKDGFLAALAAKAPQLRRDGDALVSV